ncbi:uncharacterized protein LOC136027901 [Artemia franciscana]|uniref:uncharacterized protein LOC136027901 n=1 Tax=Artemia franciscana TaxID=6661 RepID=UPI0032DB89A8
MSSGINDFSYCIISSEKSPFSQSDGSQLQTQTGQSQAPLSKEQIRMPRVYKRKGHDSPLDRENMKKAVEAYIKKEGTLRGIAEKFGIKKSTLLDYVKRSKPSREEASPRANEETQPLSINFAIKAKHNRSKIEETIREASRTIEASPLRKGEKPKQVATGGKAGVKIPDVSPQPFIPTANSGHCPVQRNGPALGCIYCWNSVIPGTMKILRRKTKYCCPECQVNLCLVPCFQIFHDNLENNGAHRDKKIDGS